MTVAALGALVSVIGGTGLFAALQDSARSGTNSAESAQLAGSADIQVALATEGPMLDLQCGTFSEDLATPFFTLTNATQGSATGVASYCIKNVGSQQVTLSALSDALTDADFACTGDEELHGDTTCGPVGGVDGAGELSSVLLVSYNQVDCANVNSGTGSSMLLKDNAVMPSALGTIAPGATRCFNTFVAYQGGHPSATVQKAQSDRVTWRYRWVAQT